MFPWRNPEPCKEHIHSLNICVIHGWPADFDLRYINFDLSYLDFLDLRHPWLGDCSSLPDDVSLLQHLPPPSCPSPVEISSPSPVRISSPSPSPVRISRKTRLSAPLNPHLQHHSNLVSRATIILHAIPKSGSPYWHAYGWTSSSKWVYRGNWLAIRALLRLVLVQI